MFKENLMLIFTLSCGCFFVDCLGQDSAVISHKPLKAGPSLFDFSVKHKGTVTFLSPEKVDATINQLKNVTDASVIPLIANAAVFQIKSLRPADRKAKFLQLLQTLQEQAAQYSVSNKTLSQAFAKASDESLRLIEE